MLYMMTSIEHKEKQTMGIKSESKTTSATLIADLHRCHERIQNLKNCFQLAGLISSTLDLGQVLQSIMSTSRKILRAEACSLMLVDEATQELVFEVAQGPVASQLKGGFRLKKGEGIAGSVFDSGKALLIEDAYEDPRFHREFDLKTGYRTRSILCVPIKIMDRIIGVSQVINRIDGTPFDSEDEEILTLLCAHAAIAIENARMHRALLHKQQIESDLALATSIQRSFLPQNTPQLPGFHFLSHYRAAREVGGDFYDFIALDGERWGILIGDVSGKGIASALCMAKLTSDFRLHAIREKDPIRLMERINDLLCGRSRRGMFVTLLYMVLDPQECTLTCVNAGHIPPLLWNHEKNRYVFLNSMGGLPAGIIAGQRYPSDKIHLEPGDCLFLSTDGLMEAKNAQGERLGTERMEKAIRSGSSRVDEVYLRVMGQLKEFVQETPPADDLTLVLLGVEESR